MTKVFEALASGESLELRMYGVIGRRWDDNAVTADAVSQALKDNPSVKNINVRVSSPGGAAFEGLAIRSMLAEHPAHVTVNVEGLAASAASIIAMAGDTIRMHEGTALMIHEASTVTEGDSKEHQRSIAALETLNDGMASIYAARSGMSKDECRALMAAETWLTPEQAIGKKFADETVKAKSSAPVAFDLKPFGYKHAPAEFETAESRQLEIPGSVAATSVAELTSQSTGTIANAFQSGIYSTSDQLLGQMSGQLSGLTFTTVTTAPLSAAATTQPVPPQVAVATTAEPPTASRKRSKMTINLIAQAVGLQADAEESAVVAAVSRLNAMVAELRSVAGADSSEALLGAVRGLVETAKQVPVLQAQIDERSKALEAQKRAAIFAADAADPKGRKLTPATQAFWAERPVAELEAFLAAAPHIIVTAPASSTPSAQQPSAAMSDPHASATAEPVKHNGKAWEDMKPAEKAALHDENPEVYAALHKSFVERGKPRAQSQQQRASA